ncbi:LOW QUALITY PROTEIN: hypothetical protein HID58_094381 [Brassica napus]|uniref:F-box domain-containing protein n=1 Tax=Brassica napus TaxID=3708 RepID=A0ABQ7X7H4_BRANA|nr:LOW QUALITY PROTEIN: hypothetical protein HID58_094381 [Brassica napus]
MNALLLDYFLNELDDHMGTYKLKEETYNLVATREISVQDKSHSNIANCSSFSNKSMGFPSHQAHKKKSSNPSSNADLLVEKTPMREVTRRTCVIMEIEDMTTQTQATEPLENEGERTEKAKCIPQDTILIGEVEINPYHPELKVIERYDPINHKAVEGADLHDNYRGFPTERRERYREESSSSRALRNPPAGTSPIKLGALEVPPEAMEEALGEVRDAMLQYTKCADPTESAARKERMRQAEEKGQLEETAARMVRATIAAQTLQPSHDTQDEELASSERIPALQRLGPQAIELPPENSLEDLPVLKRKPGRPPGRKQVQSSPRLVAGVSARKRKVLTTRPPLCRRKITTTEAPQLEKEEKRKREKPNSSRGDLTSEILFRLPAKSVGRFRCVSKLWLSITTDPCFIKSFGTTRPSLLLCSIKGHNMFVNSIRSDSSSQPIHPYPTKVPGRHCYFSHMDSVHGLICIEDVDTRKPLVWNPTMGQLLVLPKPKMSSKHMKVFLGYDSVQGYDTVVMSFDVRSEIFHMIKLPTRIRWDMLISWDLLISYEGRLACIDEDNDKRLWSLEDATDKHKWSFQDFLSPLNKLFEVQGSTHADHIDSHGYR